MKARQVDVVHRVFGASRNQTVRAAEMTGYLYSMKAIFQGI